jgi:arylsulfatase A-like enzyme
MAQPNILLIVADDMGYGDFGVFNNGVSCTPALDHLVGEGVCLTQHYAASAVCAPSRAGLMTGRYPHRTGAIDTFEGRGLDRLALREVTMADLFKRAGYATGLVGKWHLGAIDPRYHPNERGFDEFVGFRGGWQDYYQWRLDQNGVIRKADGRYLTDVLSDEAASFIESHAREPFFLHVTYNAPHFPFQCPEEDVRPYAETGKFTRAVSTIYGMLQRLDKGLTRLLAEIDHQGITENTIVLFTSDNGPQLGGTGDQCTDRFNCGFRGAKGTVYEGGIRVPMVVRWPAQLAAGTSSDALIHFTDWLPTLLAAAGLTPPAGLALDGRNVLPVLRGESLDVEPRRFWQWNRYTPLVTSNAAMRYGDWKLVRPTINESMWVQQSDLDMDRALKYQPERFGAIARDPEPERQIPVPPPAQLFNLKTDPLEEHDLADDETERVRRMLRDLESWFEDVETERKSIRE